MSQPASSSRSHGSETRWNRLAPFTPQQLARTWRERPDDSHRKPESPASREPSSAGTRPLAAQIHIDLGTVLKGAVAVAEFFTRRAAAQREAAQRLPQRALVWAERLQGVLGVSDLRHREGCSAAQAQECLEALERAGICQWLSQHQGEALYVFPAYLPRQWHCDYCATQAPVAGGVPWSATCSCQQCGAPMTQKLAGDLGDRAEVPAPAARRRAGTPS